ncbi:MAG: DUF4124 domain-containing protein [Candidatus Contendobacter sp.]|nr:DUF4124 domain-containing protein [Candidatus Contendobacter sp.]
MNGPKRLSEARRGRVGALGWAGIWSLMLSVGLAFAGDDEVYTWKDAAGRVHYGNHPPEGQAAEPVQLNTKPVTVQPTRHIYTWTDAEGKIHYGARPPPDIPAKEIKEEDSSLSTIRSTQVREGERQLLREQGEGE